MTSNSELSKAVGSKVGQTATVDHEGDRGEGDGDRVASEAAVEANPSRIGVGDKVGLSGSSESLVGSSAPKGLTSGLPSRLSSKVMMIPIRRPNMIVAATQEP